MPKTVLVCDDDDSVRAILARVLSPHYAVTGATCGSDALARIREHCPNLVLLDMRMPGLTGLDTLKAYHKTNPHLPTVVLTGDQEPEDAAQALQLGARVYITKPFEAAVVLDEVRRILGTVTQPEDRRERPPWRVIPGGIQQ